MSKCWNCETEITLKEKETRCDNCGEISRFWCWRCKEPFDVEKNNKDKLEECKTCGFFICPNCSICGSSCEKTEWKRTILNIFNNEIISLDKLNKLIKYIEEIKIGKERKICPENVPISYAKNRIKMCLARVECFGKKNEFDKIMFKDRLTKLQNRPLGYTFTINQERENGNYGQEIRDVANLCVCLGNLNMNIKEVIENKKKRKYFEYTRINKGQCPYLIEKSVIIKKCPKCNKIFSKDVDYCLNCSNYKKGRNKGLPIKLITKITNEDTCQLQRGNFNKYDKGNSK